MGWREEEEEEEKKEREREEKKTRGLSCGLEKSSMNSLVR